MRADLFNHDYKGEFFEALVFNDKKYSLLKYTVTNFEPTTTSKASQAMTQTLSNGRYVDKVTYFLFFSNMLQPVELKKKGTSFLSPLQISFESPKFMLPIRLGTVNANGPQELFIYALTRTGRVETTNYRTVKLPSGSELPPYVKDDFPRFYRAMFEQQVRRESMSAVFLEYAWDMAWCDPCAADPMSASELKTLGVFWTGDDARAGQNVFVTRLHVRYDAQHFPEDLVFQQTGDRENFQGRYVLRHAWTGGDSCPAATDYKRTLSERREKEAQTLSNLTGWRIEEIRKQASLPVPPTTEDVAWWRRIWK